MRRVRPPEKGDRIIHTEDSFDRVTTGTVTLVLTEFFVYATPEGWWKSCMFSEDWKIDRSSESLIESSSSGV